MKRIAFCMALAVLLVLAAVGGVQAQAGSGVGTPGTQPVLSAVSGRVNLAPGGFVPMAEPATAGACGSAAHCTTLTWTESTVAPAGYTLTYNVFRGTASGAEGTTPINAAPLTTTSYVDPVTLGSANQTFYYTVQAVETGAIVQTATSSEVSDTFPSILVAPAVTTTEQ